MTAALVALYGAIVGAHAMPARLATLMTWPLPCLRIAGMNASQPWATPRRFTPTIQPQSSPLTVPISPATATPALLMMRSTPPNFSCAKRSRASTDSRFETSQTKVSIGAPDISAAVSFRPSSRTSAPTTRAPRRDSSMQNARPSPLPAPVTTALGCTTSVTTHRPSETLRPANRSAPSRSHHSMYRWCARSRSRRGRL